MKGKGYHPHRVQGPDLHWDPRRLSWCTYRDFRDHHTDVHHPQPVVWQRSPWTTAYGGEARPRAWRDPSHCAAGEWSCGPSNNVDVAPAPRCRERSPSVISATSIFDDVKRSQEHLANRVLEQDQKLQKQSEQMAKMAQSLEDLKSSRADAVRHRQEGEKLVGLAMAEIDSKAKQLDETSPVARCQTALARLLESMARLERGESPLSGDGRKGSWAATLRAASGRLLAVLRELSDDALAKYSHRATEEAAGTKSRRKLGNEIYRMRRGHMDDSH